VSCPVSFSHTARAIGNTGRAIIPPPTVVAMLYNIRQSYTLPLEPHEFDDRAVIISFPLYARPDFV
jgi:hypothetical protein